MATRKITTVDIVYVDGFFLAQLLNSCYITLVSNCSPTGGHFA